MAIKNKKTTAKNNSKSVSKKKSNSRKILIEDHFNPLSKRIKSNNKSFDEIKKMLNDVPPITHKQTSTSLCGFSVSDSNVGQIMPTTSSTKESDKNSQLSKSVSDLIREGRDRVVQITVRNVSNYTLRNVKLFDDNFMNQQDIHYSTGVKEISYIDLLRRKNALDKPETKIKLIHIQSSNTNQPWQSLKLTDSDIDGTTISVPHWPVLDPYQSQAGVATVKKEFGFYIGSNIIIDVLLADAKATYSIYLTNS